MTRGRDGRPRPHRSGEPEQFHRCGDLAALQALAGATRAAGRECWCSVLPRTEPVAGGKAVAGRDGAVGRRRHPGHAVARPGPARAPARAPGRRVRRGRGPNVSRAGTSTWSPRAGCRPPSWRPPTPAWPSCWAATVSATAGGSCACPARATSRGDGRGAGAAWWPATCTRRRSTSSRSWARCLTTLAPAGVGARRGTTIAAVRAGRARSAPVVRPPRARPSDQRLRLRAVPAARRPHPLAQALRRAARRVVLLGVRAWWRRHRVRGMALVWPAEPRPRCTTLSRADRPSADRARHPRADAGRVSGWRWSAAIACRPLQHSMRGRLLLPLLPHG